MLSYFCYILLFISRLTSLSLALQTTNLIKHGTNSYTTNSGTTHRMAGCGTPCCNVYSSLLPLHRPLLTSIRAHRPTLLTSSSSCLRCGAPSLRTAFCDDYRCIAVANGVTPRGFLIWSVIYNLFPWITGLLGVEPKVILDFFPYSGEEVMRQSLQ